MRSQIDTKTLSAKEVAFLAEQEPIYILPRYTMNGIELISNDMPKLKALQRREVSLWLAVLLKKQNKCNIVIPDWLSLPYLKAKLKEEEKRKERVTELPWHWIPTSKILLDICPDDFIDSPHELRSLIQDLREIRMLKLRQGFAMIDDEYLEMTGLSLMEINEVRPFLLKTMDTLRDLKKVSIDEEEEEIGGREEEEGENERGQQEDDDEIFDRSHTHNTSNLNDSYNHEIQQQQQQQRSNISDDDIGGKQSAFNTSGLGNDSTLVEFDNSTSMAAPYHTTKRRRVDHRENNRNNNKDSNKNNNNNNNNNSDDNSDEDSDVEYRD